MSRPVSSATAHGGRGDVLAAVELALGKGPVVVSRSVHEEHLLARPGDDGTRREHVAGRRTRSHGEQPTTPTALGVRSPPTGRPGRVSRPPDAPPLGDPLRSEGGRRSGKSTAEAARGPHETSRPRQAPEQPSSRQTWERLLELSHEASRGHRRFSRPTLDTVRPGPEDPAYSEVRAPFRRASVSIVREVRPRSTHLLGVRVDPRNPRTDNGTPPGPPPRRAGFCVAPTGERPAPAPRIGFVHAFNPGRTMPPLMA